MNAKWASTTLETGPHVWRRSWHRGWVHAQNSPNSWPRDYDRMSVAEQIAYEQGRIHVFNIIAAGLPIPRWDGSKAGARAASKAMHEAIAKVGNPWPPTWKGEA